MHENTVSITTNVVPLNMVLGLLLWIAVVSEGNPERKCNILQGELGKIIHQPWVKQLKNAMQCSAISTK